MSKFLAPIHDQLFGCMLLVNERLSLLITEAITRWGAPAEEAQAMAWEEYGRPLPSDTRLSDVIDLEDIHGWLWRRLILVECREASFVAYLSEKVGNEAYIMGEEIYEKDGQRAGKAEKERMGEIESPAELYRCLYRHLLNGMPCDNVDEVILDTNQIYQWKKIQMPQREAWQKTSVDVAKMQKLYTAWAKGFFSAFEPEFKTTISFDEVNHFIQFTFEKME